MIKITLAIIIVVLLGYLGYGLEKYYKTRLTILKDYRDFIIFTERETDFLKSNIEQIVEKYPYKSAYLQNLLTNILKNEKCDCRYLNQELISSVTQFMSELSKVDYNSKNVALKNANDRAQQMISIAEKDKTQKGELGRKLIILLGIGLIILII